MRWGNKQGFTIVELLIVVVVIAILAAITIVSYNGITARSKQAMYASDAGMLAKKAEQYKTLNSVYPPMGTLGDVANFGAASSASALPSSISTISMTYALLPSVDYDSIMEQLNSSVKYYYVSPCTTPGYTGITIAYPDPVSKTVKYLKQGAC